MVRPGVASPLPLAPCDPPPCPHPTPFDLEGRDESEPRSPLFCVQRFTDSFRSLLLLRIVFPTPTVPSPRPQSSRNLLGTPGTPDLPSFVFSLCHPPTSGPLVGPGLISPLDETGSPGVLVPRPLLPLLGSFGVHVTPDPAPSFLHLSTVVHLTHQFLRLIRKDSLPLMTPYT